jgi:hypothetical protein
VSRLAKPPDAPNRVAEWRSGADAPLPVRTEYRLGCFALRPASPACALPAVARQLVVLRGKNVEGYLASPRVAVLD